MESGKRRRALITGSSRGIGLGVAWSFARNGIEVVLHGRARTTALEQLAEQMARETGTPVSTAGANLASEVETETLFAQAGNDIDILVNNAGFETMSPLETQPASAWKDTLQVNLHAPIMLSQHFARARIAAGGGGVIINVSSIHQSVPRKGFAAYSIAKAGLDMLTRSSALEWAEHGIRVISVAPGAIETDINRDAIEALGRDNFNEWIPAGRIGTVSDLDALLTFLVSDSAAYITGTSITVDGGYTQALVRYDPRQG